jgi:hypothetical protein
MVPDNQYQRAKSFFEKLKVAQTVKTFLFHGPL